MPSLIRSLAIDVLVRVAAELFPPIPENVVKFRENPILSSYETLVKGSRRRRREVCEKRCAIGNKSNSVPKEVGPFVPDDVVHQKHFIDSTSVCESESISVF